MGLPAVIGFVKAEGCYTCLYIERRYIRVYVKELDKKKKHIWISVWAAFQFCRKGRCFMESNIFQLSINTSTFAANIGCAWFRAGGYLLTFFVATNTNNFRSNFLNQHKKVWVLIYIHKSQGQHQLDQMKGKQRSEDVLGDFWKQKHYQWNKSNELNLRNINHSKRNADIIQLAYCSCKKVISP